MTDLIDTLSKAATSAAGAAEQARLTVERLEAGQAAGANDGARAVVTSLSDATRRLTTVSGRLATESLDTAGAASIGRSLRGLSVAEGSLETAVGRVAASTGGATLASGLQSALSDFGEALGQTGRAFAATGRQLAESAGLLPVSSLATPETALPATATSAQPHLLVLSADNGERYYFGLGTAAYDSLKRSTTFNVAAQERLQRQEALQAVSQGGETISVSGAIFTKTKAGARQLDTLRRIGAALLPLQLTTGYGDVLGRWYLTKIDEDQSGLMADGAPRKQTFTLEFRRYGDDYANG